MAQNAAVVGETHTLSFELESDNIDNQIKNILHILTANDGIVRFSIEVESTNPFQELQNHLEKYNNPVKKETDRQKEQEKETVENEKDTDSSKNKNQSFQCEHCTRIFDSSQELNGHLAWCDEYKKEENEEEDSLKNISIKPETWKFRIGSTLLHSSNSLTSEEIEQILAGTEWEQKKKRISGTLSELAGDEVAIRKRREVSNQGANPYEYQLSTPGEALFKSVEETAKEKESPVFYTINPNSSELEQESDGETKSQKTNQEKHNIECSICDKEFEKVSSLQAHQYSDHEKDEIEIGGPVIKPRTNKFKVISVIENTAKPVIPSDISNRVQGTEWEIDSSSISSVLSDLHKEDIVTRERRTSQRGKPFEYKISDVGKPLIQYSKECAKEEGVKTYEEVIAGK